MHCLCKSISTTSSSSAAGPITSNVYSACRAVGFQRLLSSYKQYSYLHTLPAFRKKGGVFCSTELKSFYVRLGLHPFFNCKVFAVAHHSFSTTRGFKSAPKKNALRNPSPSSNSTSNLKKGKVNASKDSPAKVSASLKSAEAQKINFTKQKRAETRTLKPVQAQSKSFSRSVQEKAEFLSHPSQVKARSSSTRVKPVQVKAKDCFTRADQEKADFASHSSQAKTRNSSTQVKPVQAKAKDSSKQVQKRFVVDEPEDSEITDEFDEDLDDDEEDLSDDVDEDSYESEEFDSEEEEELDDEFVEEDAENDELVGENDAFIDDLLEEEGEGGEDVMLGDGGDGGGVRISQTVWGEKALSIAKGVLEEFGDNFSLYAFKTSVENRVYARIDKLTDRYGSPSMVEIESFSSLYGKRLEEAGQAGTVPNNIALEVSSPGAERAVQIPDQLVRFKDLPMLVRYEEVLQSENKKSSPVVKDSILQLASVDTELGKSVWKMANVRPNREQSGKGRGLTKKQKEWRLELPFSSLRLVRLYMDV